MIAVVIRGQVRTWNFCKQQTFNVFESKYSSIHWYFLTWEDSVNETRLDNLYKDFQDKNATIKILPRDDNGNNSWNSQRRLGYEIVDEIQKYTQIYEMRPDVYLEVHDRDWVPTSNTKWYVTGVRTRQELCKENGKYVKLMKTGVSDWFYVQTPEMFRIFTEGYKEPMKLEGPRVQLFDIAKRNNIQTEDISSKVTPWVVRPTYTHETLFGHEKMWMGMPSKQKIELLESLNIAHKDYRTNNRFISI